MVTSVLFGGERPCYPCGMSPSVVLRAAAVPDMPAVARLAAKLVRFHHALEAQRLSERLGFRRTMIEVTRER